MYIDLSAFESECIVQAIGQPIEIMTGLTGLELLGDIVNISVMFSQTLKEEQIVGNSYLISEDKIQQQCPDSQ